MCPVVLYKSTAVGSAQGAKCTTWSLCADGGSFSRRVSWDGPEQSQPSSSNQAGTPPEATGRDSNSQLASVEFQHRHIRSCKHVLLQPPLFSPIKPHYFTLLAAAVRAPSPASPFMLRADRDFSESESEQPPSSRSLSGNSRQVLPATCSVLSPTACLLALVPRALARVRAQSGASAAPADPLQAHSLEMRLL